MLALPEVLAPYPIPAYPKNPPPLRMFGAADLPEANVVHDGTELAVRYEVTGDGDCYLRAIKINGSWHDPVAWLSPSAIKCLENECAEIEREVRAEGDE